MGTSAAGGGNNLAVDHAALRRTASLLTEAGTALDGCGATTPQCLDEGDAAALVAAMLAAFTDTAAKLVAETSVVGAAVEACGSELAETDAEQALAVVSCGVR